MIGVLIDELGSQEAAARALGKSPTWLSKRKRVLAAPALAAAVERGEISLDHAYDIATRAADEAVMLAQLERVRAGEQSQGATRDALAPCLRPAPTGADPAAPSGGNGAMDSPSPYPDAGEGAVDLGALAIVRLARARTGRAPRRAALDALRADLALLEGN